MALDAVVYPNDYLFTQSNKELFSMNGVAYHELEHAFFGMGVHEHLGLGGEDWGCPYPSLANHEMWDARSSSEACFDENGTRTRDSPAMDGGGRKKRRRAKASKNREEVESQRMTHIAVERNRRKQMNDYLSVLRSLMPPSYVQRGDQASIIGGAINFVRELEQLLQSLEAQRRLAGIGVLGGAGGECDRGALPFAHVFTFPQYTTCSSSSAADNRPAIADIEVTMVESHANLKVLSRQRPKQLLKMVVGLQGLRLTTLHLNVTTVEQMVLYSFSLKVEDDCVLSSVDEIAAAVYGMLGEIQEAGLNQDI